MGAGAPSRTARRGLDPAPALSLRESGGGRSSLDQRSVSVGVNPGKPIGFRPRVPWFGMVLLVIAIVVHVRNREY